MISRTWNRPLALGLAMLGLSLVGSGAWLVRRRPSAGPTGPAAGARVSAADQDDTGSLRRQGPADAAGAGETVETGDPSQDPLLEYLVLLVALSIPLWVFGGQRLPLPVDLPVSALISLNPALAAAIITYRRHGVRGLRRLLSRAVDWGRTQPRTWYAPVLLFNPLVFLTSYAVMRLTGQPLPEPEVRWLLAPVYFLLFLPFAAGEELGWMGYAVHPAQRRWGALGAGLVLGVIWALWHLVGDVQVGNSASWVLWHRLGTVGLRVLMVSLYNNTGGSVFAAILFHDMNNVSWALFPNNGSHYNPFITTVLVWAAVALVAARWGPRTLAGGPAARGSAAPGGASSEPDAQGASSPRDGDRP